MDNVRHGRSRGEPLAAPPRHQPPCEARADGEGEGDIEQAGAHDQISLTRESSPCAAEPDPMRPKLPDYLLALAIGAGLALYLVLWWGA